MSPRAHKRIFDDHHRVALLESTAAYRSALLKAVASAPMKSMTYKAIEDGLELTRAIGEILTGDPFYFAGRHKNEQQRQPRFPLTGGDLREAADEVIAMCGGDPRAAVESMLVGYDFLEAELALLSDAVQPGHPRGWFSPRLR